MHTNPHSEHDNTPLFVDLDGTLIKSDMLYESFFSLLKLNPLYCLLIPFWLLRGKAHMKQMISQRTTIEVSTLPYSEEFVSYLQSEAKNGRKIILATATNQILAKKIAEHLGFFSAVLASDINTNLSGTHKLEAIKSFTNNETFDYAANGKIDIRVWKFARKAILVNPDKGIQNSVKSLTAIDKVFIERKTGLLKYIKAIRAYQWMKNLLIFLPLFTAHQFTNIPLIFNASIAFVAFSICASGVYILNDLLDLPVDRVHPRKRLRPFASGDINLLHGMILSVLLPATGLTLAYFLSSEFFNILLIYMLMTTAYSLKFKSYAIIDILLLAALYTIRIFAGAIAINVALSFWLLTFSMFIFLSLALVKRSSELIMLANNNHKKTSGRGYHVEDLDLLKMMGVTSGFMSILVIALYIDNPSISQNYSHPQLLWLLCPVLLLWISRIWLKTGRGEMHDDPLVFAIKDYGSLVVILTCGVIVALSI